MPQVGNTPPKFSLEIVHFGLGAKPTRRVK
jgi:hypothetical protein